MKKLIIMMLVISLFVSSILFAELPPYPYYCEHHGYTIERVEGVPYGYCVFDDNTKCKTMDFYEGTCGTEYVKEISCRQEGETVFHFEECCGDMEPSSRGKDGPALCTELSFFEKVWGWFISLF